MGRMDVDIGMSEVVGFIYTLGVLVTGMWASTAGLPPVTPYNVAIVLLLGVGWTVYFSWSVVPKLIEIHAESGDENGETNQAELDF